VEGAPDTTSPALHQLPFSISSECQDLQARIADLEEQQRFSQRAMDGLIEDARGIPFEWPADLPEYHQPANVEPEARKVVADCGIDGLDLVDVDCSEPPCYAVMRVPSQEAAQDFRQCSSGRIPEFSKVTGGESSRVECADGSLETIYVYTVGATESVLDLDSGDDTEVWRLFHRFKTRMDTYRSVWICVGEEG